jgi:hypothetical protein
MNARIQESSLFAALHTLPDRVYVELAPAGAQASRLAREFAQSGWRGLHLTPSDSGADASIDALLASAGLTAAHWMAVRGDAPVRALGDWEGRACRPLVVLVETGPLASPAVPAPAWRQALARNGYLFAISDDGYHHFVRTDHAALHAQLAERASLAWSSELQASRNALAQAQREAELARSALLMAQAKGMAADARAAMLQQQIDAIHASTSWRSTKLLRWSARLRHEPGPALRQLREVTRVRLAAALPRLFARLAGKVNGNPRLRGHLAALAARHPALARRVRERLHRATSAPNPMASALAPAIDPNNIIGPQFKTLLLDELGRGVPPASG